MTDLTQVRALLLDYGGTLDTDALHWAHVIAQGYQAVGVRVDADSFRQAYVHGERELARHRIIMPDDDFGVLLRKKMRLQADWLLAHGAWPAAVPDAYTAAADIAGYCYRYAAAQTAQSRQVLELLLDKGYDLVLVSNFYGNLTAVLRDFGLYPLFRQVVESAVVGVRKPDAAIWQLGVQATGLEAGRTLAVGDSYDKDMAPAMQVGCRTLWIKGQGWSADEAPVPVQPDAVVRHLAELPRVLGL